MPIMVPQKCQYWRKSGSLSKDWPPKYGTRRVNPSGFISISWVFDMGNGFLWILWFIFLKLDNNLTVSLFSVEWKWGIPTPTDSPFYVPLVWTAVLLISLRWLCVHVSLEVVYNNMVLLLSIVIYLQASFYWFLEFHQNGIHI